METCPRTGTSGQDEQLAAYSNSPSSFDFLSAVRRVAWGDLISDLLREWKPLRGDDPGKKREWIICSPALEVMPKPCIPGLPGLVR